jgi:O-antigen ligase
MTRSHPKSSAALKIVVFAGAISIGAVVILTGRLEIAALLAIPVALMLLQKYRLAVAASVWAMVIWGSRLPVVLFEFTRFSYVVYACIGIAMAAYALRLLSFGPRNAPFIGRIAWPVWLMLAVLILGAIHGAPHAAEIPDWLVPDDSVDFRSPWPYFRTFALPAIFQVVLALMIASAFSKGQFPREIVTAAAVMVWTISVMIIGFVALSGLSLRELAQPDERNFLSELGFHANTFGAFLAIAYALMLGLWNGMKNFRAKVILASTIGVTLLALLLSFSRGAYLASTAVTLVFFMRGSAVRKLAFVAVLVGVSFVLPAAVFHRAEYGIQTGDLNAISAGRIDLIWLPLLPDAVHHLLMGQGLNSVMWTAAQRDQLMAPVVLSHNGYLDLLLDFGIAGAIPILAAYAFLWRGFLRLSKAETDTGLRGLFYGGHLALGAFSLICMTSERITPTTTSLFIWMAGGVLIGRMYFRKYRIEDPTTVMLARPEFAPALAEYRSARETRIRTS